LLDQVLELSGGYLIVGDVLMNIENRFSCDIVIEGFDSGMLNAFMAAGAHWRGTPEMAAIATHQSVVYLIGKGGSRANAEALMKAAAGLLKAGGLGVKVESTGIAHDADAWLDFTSNLHLFTPHCALVLYVTGLETYSCGMHNFGHKDAITLGQGDRAATAELLKAFNWYVLTESPRLVDGESFAVSRDAPVYTIHAHPGIQYEANSLFTNPYGAWYLAPPGFAEIH